MAIRSLNAVGYAMPGARLSHAVVVDPGHRLVFLSGLTARGPAGEPIAPGDAHGQALAILATIQRLLEQAGGSMRDVVKLTVFLRDMAALPAVSEARELYFAPPYPASSVVEVSRLAGADRLVEIEAIAALPVVA